MTKGINKVILVGNVGNTPEIKSIDPNTMVANFSLATSEKWKDKNTGEMKESTEWHRLCCFKGLAEVVQKYVNKGDKLYVEGKVIYRKYTDKNGVDRYATDIRVHDLAMLGSGGVPTAPESSPPPRQSAPPQPAPADFDDDIPF